MRLNNKGFAISTILYSLLVMATLVLFLLIGNFSFERRSTNDFVSNIEDDLNSFANVYSNSDKLLSKVLLANVKETGNYYDDGTDTFITGDNPNNYIWYSGRLWRAVNINNNEKTTKIVTQWNVTRMAFSASGNYSFDNSDIKAWLNDTSSAGFLESLYNYNNIIATNSSWFIDVSYGNLRSEGTTVTSAVGLLNKYEFDSSYHGSTAKNSYLANGDSWWTLTRHDVRSDVLSIDGQGGLGVNAPSNTDGIRPAINIKSNVKITSGTGTIEDPYILENGQGDSEKTLFKNYIMELRNDENNTDYSESSDFEKKQMYKFEHINGNQQSNWLYNDLVDYRYIGENPNNYVKFNSEEWRIIGVFTVEKSDGSKEQLVKIRKSESLGGLSWDANSNKSYSDIWSKAEVQKMLNNVYLSSAATTYYNYAYTSQTLSTINLNFASTGLKNVNDKIETVKWYTAPFQSNDYINYTADEIYVTERSNNKTTSGGAESWIGKIALVYPSDYIYANANNYNKSCFNKPFGNTSCGSPLNWLGNVNGTVGTITALNSGKNIVQYTLSQMSAWDSSRKVLIYPTLYLKSTVELLDGDGTKNNPYILS